MLNTSRLRLTLSGMLLMGVAAFASNASAATITGTLNNAGLLADAFTVSDFTDENGDAYGTDPFLLLCLSATLALPTVGEAYTFSSNAGASALVGGGGTLGIAGVNYLFDNYYEKYLKGSFRSEQWAFQQAVWELGTDFTGDPSSFDATKGSGRPVAYSEDFEDSLEYNAAWQAIYADLGAALTTLDPNYKSTKYTIDFFYSADPEIQHFVAIQEIAPAPVPVPAGLPLVLSGLGALGLFARKKRS